MFAQLGTPLQADREKAGQLGKNYSCTAARQGWQLIPHKLSTMPAHLAALPAKFSQV